jgi:hypothetical protein
MICVFKKVIFYIQTQILDFTGKITLRRTKKSVTKKTEPGRRKKNGQMKKILPEMASGVQNLEEKHALADLCGFKSIPTAKVFSRVMDEERMGIEPFRELFYDLSKTSRSLGLWKGRLTGLDGSLIKSNTSSYDLEYGLPILIRIFIRSYHKLRESNFIPVSFSIASPFF